MFVFLKKFTISTTLVIKKHAECSQKKYFFPPIMFNIFHLSHPKHWAATEVGIYQRKQESKKKRKKKTLLTKKATKKTTKKKKTFKNEKNINKFYFQRHLL